MTRQLSQRDLGYGVNKTDPINQEKTTFGSDVSEQIRLAENLFREIKPEGELKIFVYLDRPKYILELVESTGVLRRRVKLKFELLDISTPQLELLRKVYRELTTKNVMLVGIKNNGGSVLKVIRLGDQYISKYWNVMENIPKRRRLRNAFETYKCIGPVIGLCTLLLILL